jgi:hypothetical protein
MSAPDPYQSQPPLGGGRLQCPRRRPRVRRIAGGRRGIADDHRAQTRGLRDSRRSDPRSANRTAGQRDAARLWDPMAPPRPAAARWSILAGTAWLLVGVAVLAAHWAFIDWLVVTLT